MPAQFATAHFFSLPLPTWVLFSTWTRAFRTLVLFLLSTMFCFQSLLGLFSLPFQSFLTVLANASLALCGKATTDCHPPSNVFSDSEHTDVHFIGSFVLGLAMWLTFSEMKMSWGVTVSLSKASDICLLDTILWAIRQVGRKLGHRKHVNNVNTHWTVT